MKNLTIIKTQPRIPRATNNQPQGQKRMRHALRTLRDRPGLEPCFSIRRGVTQPYAGPMIWRRVRDSNSRRLLRSRLAVRRHKPLGQLSAKIWWPRGNSNSFRSPSLTAVDLPPTLDQPGADEGSRTPTFVRRVLSTVCLPISPRRPNLVRAEGFRTPMSLILSQKRMPFRHARTFS